MKIISITNQKGGIGKTTTAAALLAGLTQMGYRTLAIDLDSQRNLTSTLRVDTEQKTSLQLLTKEKSAKAVIQNTQHGDIIAASRDLAGVDIVLDKVKVGREYRLKEALETIAEQYDYAIIDCPPALGAVTVNALTACDYAIIPAQADIYSIDGIAETWEAIKEIKNYSNPNIAIAGVLLTRFSDRAVLSRELEATLREEIATAIGSKVYKATIREAIAVKEAQMLHTSLFDHAPQAKVTDDYRKFINELLQDIQQ